jgi:hypothetical protein
MFIRAFVAIAFAACLLDAQAPSLEARLEAAIHAESVDGDVKGAFDQYQKLVTDATPGSRPVAARALLGMADCQQKLGQTEKAQALYTNLMGLYGDQSTIAAEARAKLTALVNTAAGPLNLNFENGIEQAGVGWFVPRGLKAEGYSAEVRHEGCRQSPSCAVILGSSTPKDQLFGNLMQSFNAAAYRGKTIRMRAFLKMDSTNPDDGAAMWFRVDRPNRLMGAFDNMQDRQVKSVNWTAAEIVGKVADDAQTVNFGVVAYHGGRAWVDGLTFEVVPNDTPETTVMSSLMSRTAPDFARGLIQADQIREGCRTEKPCSTVTGSQNTTAQNFTSRLQFFKADNYRGKTVRLRAWLKLDSVEPADSAQLWMRVDLKDQKPGFFDNMDDRPIRSSEWKQAEIVGKVADNAETIYIGLLSVGKGTAWVDSASFQIVPDGTPLTGAMSNPAVAPQNLSLVEGVPGAVPRGWFGIKNNGYSAEWRKEGCIVGPSCAVVIGSSHPGEKTFGNLMQNFSAVAYRGKTIRLRAKLKLDAVDPTDKAQMWLRVDRPDRQMGFFDNMDDRPIQTSVWTDVEIVGKIDPDANEVYFGFMEIGKGIVWVDALSFEVIPDGSAQTGKALR